MDERPTREPAGRREVPLFGSEDVADLAELVDRAVEVGLAAGDLQVGLVNEPSIIEWVPAGPGGLDQQQGEALHQR